MRPYEVMIIFDPTLDEPVLQQQVDRSSEILSTRGATVGRIERWGRRRLAYELQHHRDGYYVLMETTAEPAAVAELDRSLHLADEVLRHKVMRIPDRIAARPRPPVAVAAPDESSVGHPPAATPPGEATPSEATPSEGGAPAETAEDEETVGNGETVAAVEAAGDTSSSANGA